jgi:hypothetical protein
MSTISADSIPLPVRVDIALLAAAFGPPSFYFSLFCLYWIEGRFASYSPTVSETATEWPNTRIMSIAFGSISSLVIYTGLLPFWFLASFYRSAISARQWLAYFAVSGFFGFLGVSNFPLNTEPKLHRVTAFFALSGTIGIQFGLWRGIRPAIGRWRDALMASLVALQAVALAFCGTSQYYNGPRNRVTENALGEYALLFMLAVFAVVATPELRRADAWLVILD